MGENALTEGGALIHRSHRQQETLDSRRPSTAEGLDSRRGLIPIKQNK